MQKNNQNNQSMLSRSEFELMILGYQPELLIAAVGEAPNYKKKLIVTLDFFNNHLIWSVEMADGSSVEFDDWDKTIEYFFDGEDQVHVFQ